jgi:hypothetical protein
MPEPLIKARGQQRRMTEKKIIAWPPPLSAVSGPGQTLQDDPLPLIHDYPTTSFEEKFLFLII